MDEILRPNPFSKNSKLLTGLSSTYSSTTATSSISTAWPLSSCPSRLYAPPHQFTLGAQQDLSEKIVARLHKKMLKLQLQDYQFQNHKKTCLLHCKKCRQNILNSDSNNEVVVIQTGSEARIPAEKLFDSRDHYLPNPEDEMIRLEYPSINKPKRINLPFARTQSREVPIHEINPSPSIKYTRKTTFGDGQLEQYTESPFPKSIKQKGRQFHFVDLKEL